MSAEKLPEGSTSSKSQLSCPGVFSCSVCLESVTDAGERSIAKLKCGHHFHLDCIGSAFNAKGKMQCPNCRHVEHGQWLYASSCFLHDEFVDDLTYEDDAEIYSGSTSLQFGHTPWCPHQGSYAHLSLSFEGVDSIGNAYLDPIGIMRQGSSVSVAGYICPYLAAEGLSVGGSLHHVEDFLALQIGHRPNRNPRRAAGLSSGHRSHWQRQGLPTFAFNSIPTSYEGASQNYNSSARLLQPSPNRHHNPGVALGNLQPIHSGVNPGANHGANLGHALGQQSHSRIAQGMHGAPEFYPSTGSRNSDSGNRRPRHSATVSAPSQRSQVASSGQVWMNEQIHDYGPWGGPGMLGPGTNQHLGDGLGWATTDNQVDPWTRGIYVPQAQFGTSSQWWAWIPPGNSNSQRVSPNIEVNSYREGQPFGAGLFPRPTASSPSFTEQVSEGAYTWHPSGFC